MNLLYARGINAANSRLSSPGGGTLAQDAFTRSNGSLDGSTMSDGASTWEGTPSQGAGFSVASNQCKADDASISAQVCDSMSATADIEVSGKVVGHTDVMGVVARQTASGAYYYLMSQGGTLKMFSRTGAGAGTGAQLGSNGSAVTLTDTIKLRCEGTAISGYLNGVLDIGPIPDSDHSTGQAGVMGRGASAILDDWIAEAL